MLTPKEEAFCTARAHPECKNDSEAFRVAYNCARMKPETVNRSAHELMCKDKIVARIKELQAEWKKPIAFEVADILREWVTIGTADPGELIRHRWVACRHCWGVGHAYQWKNEAEFAAELQRVMDANEANEAAAGKRGVKVRPEPFPDAAGGFGFRRLRAPHPECPECEGEGIEDTYIADLHTVSPAARKLYAGLKRTKDGIEIKMRDQDGAMLNLAKYYGMHSDTLRLTLPPGTTAIVTSDMAPAEAAKLYQTVVSGGS